MGRKRKVKKINRSRRINLSSKDKDRIRKYETILLNKEYKYTDRLKLFHKIISPLYKNISERLLLTGTFKKDLDGSLYLISDEIFKKYNPERSSLVPYIERVLFWYLDQIKEKKEYYPLEFIEEYQLDEEFYYRVPNILFEDKYIGKLFTIEEKYVINQILTSDSFSIRKLSRDLSISRESLKQIINSIKEKIKHGNENCWRSY